MPVDQVSDGVRNRVVIDPLNAVSDGDGHGSRLECRPRHTYGRSRESGGCDTSANSNQSQRD